MLRYECLKHVRDNMIKLKGFVKEFQRVSLCLYYILLFSTPAYADTTNVTQVLKGLESLLTGTWGKVICTLAIAGVGYACFVLGRLPISRALAVAIGAACVMGAGTVLTTVTGGGQ